MITIFEDFKYFKKVRSGHIHLIQENKNFTFVGSIFQMDRNDRDDQKGIFVIDTIDGCEKFYPNTISPIFKKFIVKDESDIDRLEILKESNDYIDITISNSLLVSNRKLRRKLEFLLESGNFASVDYLDDIIIDNGESKNESIQEENMEITINLDYEDFIRNYIINQTYSSDKIKSGISSEFDEIIRIYNENYRKTKI